MSLPIKNDYTLKKGDLIMIAVILGVAGIAAILIMNQKKGNEVIIISGDNEIIYSLDEDQTIRIDSSDGGYNIIAIEDRRAYVKESDCKNQICVNHKPVYKNHESIVCVPHKLMVEIKSSEKNDIDN